MEKVLNQVLQFEATEAVGALPMNAQPVAADIEMEIGTSRFIQGWEA